MATIRVDTKYGPLDVKVYAGPTRVPGTIHANDGKYPSAGHAFGRDPDPAYIGARVSSPDLGYGADGWRAHEYLTVNRVEYTADTSFALTATGWREEYGGFCPLTRRGGFVMDGVPDGVRKAWRETIAPAVIDALNHAAQEIGQAEAEAAIEFGASVRARVEELRAEADRLVDIIAHDPRYFPASL